MSVDVKGAVKSIGLLWKYKKVLVTFAPLWAAFIWANGKINEAQEHIKLIESIPVLEEKFSSWAIETDSSLNYLSNSITTIHHAMIGELTVRRVGRLKMYLNNKQEAQELPRGGFMYNGAIDDFYEVTWDDGAEDYSRTVYVIKEKGGKLYVKETKIFLNYDD